MGIPRFFSLGLDCIYRSISENNNVLRLIFQFRLISGLRLGLRPIFGLGSFLGLGLGLRLRLIFGLRLRINAEASIF
jgi:hypothetical protein